MVLQEHYDKGSGMAVAFLVRCGLFFLGSLSRSGHTGRFCRLLESESVGGHHDKAFDPAAVNEWSYMAMFEVPIQPVGFDSFVLSVTRVVLELMGLAHWKFQEFL
jgi:hypothetical protein